MEHVFRGNRFLANSGIRECNVFRDIRPEVVRLHQHIHMFGNGVLGKWKRRVCRRRQYVRQTRNLDDVGCVSTTSTFSVECVDDAASNRVDGFLHEAILVQGIRVNRDLHVVLIGHLERSVDAAVRCAPVLVDLEANRARRDLLSQNCRDGPVALAQQPDIDREIIGRLKHALNPPLAGGDSGGLGAFGRARAAANERGDTGRECDIDLICSDKVDMCIDAASSENLAFTGDDLGGNTNDDIDAVLRIRVTGLADCGNATVA